MSKMWNKEKINDHIDTNDAAQRINNSIWFRGPNVWILVFSRPRGVIHGLQHIGRMFCQARKFSNYAPAEAWWKIPNLIRWWITKIGRMIGIGMVLILFSACHEEEEIVPLLEVTYAQKILSSDGESLRVDIHSNSKWTFDSDDQTWYSIDKPVGEGDGTVYITVEPYTEAIPRTANIAVMIYGARKDFVIMQKGPDPPANPPHFSFVLTTEGGDCSFQVPSGYTFRIVGNDVDPDGSTIWLYLGADALRNNKFTTDNNVSIQVDRNYRIFKDRSTSLKAVLTDGSLLATIDILQQSTNIHPGDLLIDEIFYAGNNIPGTDKSCGDQYIKLTNNTDHTLYSNGLYLLFSKYDSQVPPEGTPFWRGERYEDRLVASKMFYFYTSMTDQYALRFKLDSGASVYVAVEALDYSAKEGHGLDLSKADFTCFVPYDEEGYHYDVPFLGVMGFDDGIYDSPFDTNGHFSVALVIFNESDDPPFWRESYANREYSEQKILDGVAVEERSIEVYEIPCDLIIDAVNCGVAEGFGKPAFPESMDAGYAGVSAKDGDPQRFGKVIRRKRNGKKCVDSNNSSEDFEVSTTSYDR